MLSDVSGQRSLSLNLRSILKNSKLTYSIIRPGLFMELFKKLEFAPPIILGMMLKNINHHRKLPFVSLEDIGKIVTKIIFEKEKYINSDFNVITQYISLFEIQHLHKEVKGRFPIHLSLPDFIFKNVVGHELYDLWTWLNHKESQYDSQQFLKIIHDTVDFKLFLSKSKLPI